MMERKRLDQMLVELGLARSREQAKGLIMSGDVYVDRQKADKPGMEVKAGMQFEVRANPLPYVSRGGLKLEKALQAFPITLNGCVAMDIGASTGGFTDCMLQNGAARVYAIDVGYGQLAWKLRTDGRVVNLERTNIRYLTEEQVPQAVDFFSVDVSFISLTLVLPVAHRFLKTGGRAVCLVKPQFEVGKGRVGKKGVVREPELHAEVVEKIQSFAVATGFSVLGADFSPIRGPEGNIEYLLFLEKAEHPVCTAADIQGLVRRSHSELNGEMQ